jgi:hypothetical protein
MNRTISNQMIINRLIAKANGKLSEYDLPNHEMTFIDTPKPKENVMCHSNSDEYGPQRFDKDGNSLDITSDVGIWLGLDGILCDSSGVIIPDDYAVDGPMHIDDNIYANRDYRPPVWDIFEEVVCSNDKYEKDTVKRFNLEWYTDHKGMLDIKALKKLKLDRSLAKWIWTNKDTIRELYKDTDDEYDENVCNNYNDDARQLTESDYDLVANESGTHQDKAHLKFWRSMIFYIGKDPAKAYDIAIEKLHEGFLTEDECDYICELTGGVKNSGKMRYAQSIMMSHATFRKNHDVIDYHPKHTLEYIENSKYKPQPVNPALRKHRIIDVYEPTPNMKEGFVLVTDYIRGKFCNSHQHRIIGKDKCLKFYADQIQLGYNEGFMVHNRNITKLRGGIVYFQMWNLWISNVNEYCNQVKAMLK